MSASLSNVCERLIEIKDQFEENEELVEAILGSENSEDLLIAIGMALAYSEGAISLNYVGESHLKSALKALNVIAEESRGGEEE